MNGEFLMKNLAKLAIGAVLLGGLAVTAAAPAEAGVSVGIGIGVPGPGYGPGPGWRHRHWCYWHPGACAGYPTAYADGYYLAGYGWWHGGRWWGHRWGGPGAWRYR
jgi:hypothetical protein